MDQMGLTVEEKGEGVFELDGTPMDAVYSAVLFPGRYYPSGEVGMILSGVNAGANVGVDIIHSGTVAPVALAATCFAIPTLAVSQAIPPLLEGEKVMYENRELYSAASRYLPRILNLWSRIPGVCLNVNLPYGKLIGFKSVAAARYSRWLPSVKYTTTEDDITALADGYVTVTELELSWSAFMGQ